MNILVVSSTRGSVLAKVLNNAYFKKKIKLIITDRKCGIIDVAKNHDIKHKILNSKTGHEFSNKLCEILEAENYDLLISFYTKLFKGKILQIMKNRIINLHPSILPACPGLNGFEDTIKSRSRFVGATIHFVDEGLDTGSPIIQSAVPYNPLISIEENRHEVFIDQCRMLLQTIKWFDEKRILFYNKDLIIKNAKYLPGRYSPNLDYYDAIKFNIKFKQ